MLLRSSVISLDTFLRHLKRHVKDGHNIVFFLGAGCSRAAGIPICSELMDIWEEQGIDRGSFDTMMRQRYPSIASRNEAFWKICAGKVPTAGHMILANLFAEYPRQIRMCITTNVDHLVGTAITNRILQSGSTLHYRMNSRHTATELRAHVNAGAFCEIKLHGDMTDTSTMTQCALPESLVDVMRDVLYAPTMFVFIGYGGNDVNVSDWLRAVNKNGSLNNGAVYWCSQNEPNAILSPWLRKVNYTRVNGTDFDQVMTAIGI